MNLLGGSDGNTAEFRGNLAGAQSYNAETFAGIIAPLLARSGADSIRLFSSRSAANGFAEQLAGYVKLPIKAPTDVVSSYELTPGRYLFLENVDSSTRPLDYQWVTFVETDATLSANSASDGKHSEGGADLQIQTAKELYSLAEFKDFKSLSQAEKLSNSIALSQSSDGQYEYFFDIEEGQGMRLNVVGHGDKGGASFKSDLVGAHLWSAEEFADLLQPLLDRSGANSIRLLSCRAGASGFAEQLARHVQLPVKAPLGAVTQFEVMKQRYWFLSKAKNEQHPSEHEWRDFAPSTYLR